MVWKYFENKINDPSIYKGAMFLKALLLLTVITLTFALVNIQLVKAAFGEASDEGEYTKLYGYIWLNDEGYYVSYYSRVSTKVNNAVTLEMICITTESPGHSGPGWFYYYKNFDYSGIEDEDYYFETNWQEGYIITRADLYAYGYNGAWSGPTPSPDTKIHISLAPSG